MSADGSAAPAGRPRSEVLVDNSVVRVTRWSLAEGESTGPHTHEHDYVVIPAADGRMRLANADGTVSVNRLRLGAAYYRAAGAQHDVSSEGDEGLDFVEVEILGAPGARS